MPICAEPLLASLAVGGNTRSVQGDDPVLETITLDELRVLPVIDAEAGDWTPPVPQTLLDVLQQARSIADKAAEALLAPQLQMHFDDPEPWWGMAVVQVGIGDLANAATCYENFRDRVAHQLAMALDEAPNDLAAAVARLTRLAPSLRRCRDPLLAARAAIAHAGLLLAVDNVAEAEIQLHTAIVRLRALWPRPWPIAAEWLASVAIARADRGAGTRAVRTLVLALKLSRHDQEGTSRSAMIARDLGALLDRLDRLVEAEAMLGIAAELAATSHDLTLVASVATARAKNLAAQRRYVEAHAALAQALELAPSPRERIDALLATADLHVLLGSALRDRARIEQAQASAIEAVALIDKLGGNPRPAWRTLGTIAVLLGDTGGARAWLFRLIRAAPRHLLTNGERVALGYIAYLLRLAEGAHRKALFWAEWRFGLAERGGGAPRDRLTLREHCIAAAERIGAIDRVRVHARAMLQGEADMLRQALGRERGPADWNRLRLAREALSVLAWMERDADDAEAPWRLADALLAGRGLARAARRSARNGSTLPAAIPSLETIAKGLLAGQAVLALVALHPPAPVDPSRPLWNGFLPPRLVAVLHCFEDALPTIIELGDFGDCADEVERWRNALARGRETQPPPILAAVRERLSAARQILFLGEGSFEALPLRLLVPEAEIAQCAALTPAPTPRHPAAGTAPVHAIVAQDMLEDRDWRDATNREIDAIRAAGSVTLLAAGTMGLADILSALSHARRVHVIAHGDALREPAAVELDVYRGAAVELTAELNLTASEIAAQSLQQVELVVLSSCDTGLGVRQLAEGQASMAAAFLDAGAAWVIAALWPVPHEQTAQFMELLYRQGHLPPAAGLLRAQQLAIAEGLPSDVGQPGRSMVTR